MSYDRYALASPPEVPDITGDVRIWVETDSGDEILVEVTVDGRRDEIAGAVVVDTGNDFPIEKLSAWDRERAWEQAWENWKNER